MKSTILACLGMATTICVSAQVEGPNHGNQFNNSTIAGYSQT